jgi:hypothetical protein
LASVFFYVSGHGFGHASRQIEVINALGGGRPDIRIVVRTAAAAWLFHRTVRVPITVLPGECDTGVVQIDSLRLDEDATIRRAAAFYRTLPARLAVETALMQERAARLVIADAPPLACAAAAAASVPAVVVANFTWDWIYESYREHLADAPDLLPTMRRAYEQAIAAWRLPMYGGFATFDRIVDVPFVARHARHDRSTVRARLGLPAHTPLVLWSFGGYGVNDLQFSCLDCLDRYSVVVTHRNADKRRSTQIDADGRRSTQIDADKRRSTQIDADGRRSTRNRATVAPPSGVHIVSEEALYGAGFRYEDLVAAVDVVVSKPGYGIIAECLANGVAMLYTSRGRFAEYDVLLREMPRFLRCEYIDHGALFEGRWREALDRVMSQPPAPERPATNGAQVIADMIQRQIA